MLASFCWFHFRYYTSAPLIELSHTGTETRKVDRPQNWKDAGESGWAPPVYDSDQQRRAVQKDFLTKVYGILAAQLLLTCALCAIFMFVEPVTMFAYGNLWFTIVLFIINIVLIVTLFFVKNSYPWNFYLLGAFTIAMGCMIATTCAVYAVHGMGHIVALAAGATLFVFVSLTIFVQLSDIDFSFLGLFLPVCLLVFIIWMCIAIIFGFSLGMLFGALGVLLFSGFIIYDTWMIMNRMGCDDYIIASIELYLDVINVFSMMMLLFSGGDMG